MTPRQINHWYGPLMAPGVLCQPSPCDLPFCALLPYRETNPQVVVFLSGALTWLCVCATSIAGEKIQPASLSLEEASNGFWDIVHRAASPESRPAPRSLSWDTAKVHAKTQEHPCSLLVLLALEENLVSSYPSDLFLDFFSWGRHCICLLYFLPFS